MPCDGHSVLDNSVHSPDYTIAVRTLANGETEPLCAVFDAMSATSRRNRFLVSMPAQLPPSIIEHLANVDGQHHAAFLASHGQKPIGVARWMRSLSKSDTAADVAVSVVDAYQGQGVGSLLARHLLNEARRANVRELVCVYDPSNERAARLARRLSAHPPTILDGLVSCRMAVSDGRGP